MQRQGEITENNKRLELLDKISQSYSFQLPLCLSITAIITPNIGCPKHPTARSEKVRLRKKVFKLAGIDEAFHRARRIIRFSRVATREKVKFETQKAKHCSSMMMNKFCKVL